jgi:hypothetical protein
MSQSTMSEAQKRDAYREAQQILRLDKTWKQLMPGERKPNFRRAAREVIRRALGHKVRRNETPLQIHEGTMEQHDAREAALLERTLRNGMHPPNVLHSFQRGTQQSRDELPKQYSVAGDDADLPDIDVFVHDSSQTIDYPSHYEPGTGTFHSSVHEPPDHAEVAMRVPQNARLPSDYEAVH